jgi:hypothetical protein
MTCLVKIEHVALDTDSLTALSSCIVPFAHSRGSVSGWTDKRLVQRPEVIGWLDQGLAARVEDHDAVIEEICQST